MTLLKRIYSGGIRRIKGLYEDAASRLGILNRTPNLGSALKPGITLAAVDEWGKEQTFYFEEKGKEQVIALLKQIEPEAPDLLAAEAERICQHVFDLLGSGPTHLGDKIDWHVDFKTGHRWNPRKYYKRIRPAPYPGGYDIKVPWELSRCQHFVQLGQAYWITDDEKYAKEFVAQVTDWIESNPSPWGVNWASTMDVAIRVVNWLWGYHFFITSPNLSSDFRLLFYNSLLIHGRHIRKNLENEGITTNHYLSNLVGLVYLGILCPEFDEASEWRTFGLKELWQEMLKQVHVDGTDYEGSIAYHRLVTECYLSVILLCRLNSILIPDWAYERLENMLEFVMWYTKPDGTVPLVGDADNGRLHRLKVWDPPEQEWLDHRYLLGIGAALFDRSDFATASGDQLEEAIWLSTLDIDGSLLGESSRQVKRISQVAVANFTYGGFHIAKDSQLFLIVRGGSIGTAGLGNHTHNDALSFEWSFQGTTLIRDSGTGIYTADYDMRQTQRSIRSHSTLCIDDREPSSLFVRRPFSLSGRRLVSGEMRKQSGDYMAQCNLSSKGYQGMPQNFEIRRQIQVDQLGASLIIVDGVRGAGKHIVESSFILGDVSQVIITDNEAACSFITGSLQIEFALSRKCMIWTEKVWQSDSYGNFSEGCVVRCREEVVLPFQTETHLRFEGIEIC